MGVITANQTPRLEPIDWALPAEFLGEMAQVQNIAKHTGYHKDRRGIGSGAGVQHHQMRKSRRGSLVGLGCSICTGVLAARPALDQ